MPTAIRHESGDWFFKIQSKEYIILDTEEPRKKVEFGYLHVSPNYTELHPNVDFIPLGFIILKHELIYAKTIHFPETAMTWYKEPQPTVMLC